MRHNSLPSVDCVVIMQEGEYNIPVVITVPADYPIMAPVCLVEPTPTMELSRSTRRYRLHPEAGASTRGRVETGKPWVPEHSSLIDVIIDMCELFSIDPPVKSRDAPQSQPAASPYPANDRPPGSNPPQSTGNPAYPSYTPGGTSASGRAAGGIKYPSVSYPGSTGGAGWYPPAGGPAQSPFQGGGACPRPPAQPYGDPPAPSGYAGQAEPAIYPGRGGAAQQQPAQPAAPRFAKDAHVQPFKEKAVAALTARVQESLQLSCEALSEEVASLESTAEKLARNQHVRCIKTASSISSHTGVTSRVLHIFIQLKLEIWTHACAYRSW